MHFVVLAIDRTTALAKRLDVIGLHRTYLSEAPHLHGIKVLLSGPLTQDDGETMRGSFFLLDAPDRASVKALFAGDPLMTANVWKTIEISAVHVRQNNMNGL